MRGFPISLWSQAHSFQTGTQFGSKFGKKSLKLQWTGPHSVVLTTLTDLKFSGVTPWVHHSRIKRDHHLDEKPLQWRVQQDLTNHAPALPSTESADFSPATSTPKLTFCLKTPWIFSPAPATLGSWLVHARQKLEEIYICYPLFLSPICFLVVFFTVGLATLALPLRLRSRTLSFVGPLLSAPKHESAGGQVNFTIISLTPVSPGLLLPGILFFFIASSLSYPEEGTGSCITITGKWNFQLNPPNSPPASPLASSTWDGYTPNVISTLMDADFSITPRKPTDGVPTVAIIQVTGW